MFKPTPPHIAQVRTQGDKDAAKALLPQGRKLLASLQNRLQLGGVTSGAAELYLEDGSYLHVRQAMGVNIITLVAGAAPPEGKQTNVEYYYPDVLGGLHNGTNFHPNASTASYSTAEQRNQKLQGVQASSIECFPATHFSGQLKKVVQFCRGYFKHNGDFWGYKTAGEGNTNPTRRWPVFWDTPDWGNLFEHSNGLMFAGDGTPWLVQISWANGILAGPLPLHPDTCGDNFDSCRAYFVEKGLSEVVEVLDWLGGLPTGEGIPINPPEAKIWLDAGLGRRLANYDLTDPFLDELTPFSDYMGFAFNESGTAAHNTAYSEDENGVRTSHHWKLELGQPSGKLPNPKTGYRAILARIWPIIGGTGDVLGRVILAKLRVLTNTQISDALSMADDMAVVNKVLNAHIWATEKPSLGAIGVAFEEVEQGTLDLPRELRFPWLGNIAGWPNNNAWDAPTTPYRLDFGGEYGGRFPATFSDEGNSIAPNAKNTQKAANGEWHYEPADCDTTFFVYFKGDTLCKVKWKLVNRPTQTPSSSKRTALRDFMRTFGGSDDTEVAACRFGALAGLANAQGVDGFLAHYIDYAHEYFQPAWVEAGFYCEEENIEALHLSQDFAFEPDESTLKAEDLGQALMRRSLSSTTVYQVKIIRVTQTVYWHAHLPHAQFRSCPSMAREFCCLVKAHQEVRIPMRFYCAYGVLNPHYAYIKNNDGATSLEQATASFTHCQSSHQDGWDWLENSSPKPFYQNNAGTWLINTHALGRDYKAVLPADLSAPYNGAGNGLIFVHQLSSEVQDQYVILNSGNLGRSTPSGVVQFTAGLTHSPQALPDGEQEILDEQAQYWLLGDHAHTNAATPFEIDPQDNVWFTRFTEGEVHPATLRTLVYWANAWGATWNALGDDNTLYHIVPVTGEQGHKMKKHGSNPAFPANPQTLTPQFTGINP